MGKMLAIASGKGRGRRASQRYSNWRSCGLYLLGGIGLAILLRTFFVQAYLVPSRAMEDTLLAGDYLLIDKFTYGIQLPFANWRLPGLAQPQVGEIVVFKAPLDPQRLYAKRCVAVPGQVVEIRDKVVYVDGKRLVDPPHSKYLDARILPASQSPRDNWGPQVVPPGAYFVIGDNRDSSRDSRHWGFLPATAIVGRVVCVYWSCEPDRSALGGWAGRWRRLTTLPQRIRWHRLGNWVQ